MNLKSFILLNLLLVFFQTSALQTTLTSGANALGAGVSLSYSIGTLFYKCYVAADEVVTQGLQPDCDDFRLQPVHNNQYLRSLRTDSNNTAHIHCNRQHGDSAIYQCLVVLLCGAAPVFKQSSTANNQHAQHTFSAELLRRDNTNYPAAVAIAALARKAFCQHICDTNTLRYSFIWDDT